MRVQITLLFCQLGTSRIHNGALVSQINMIRCHAIHAMNLGGKHVDATITADIYARLYSDLRLSATAS